MDITKSLADRTTAQPSLVRAPQLLTRILERWREERRIARDQRRLEAFPDHLLKDIAVSRSCIARTVREGRGQP